jgi:hypothetical protein
MFFICVRESGTPCLSDAGSPFCGSVHPIGQKGVADIQICLLVQPGPGDFLRRRQRQSRKNRKPTGDKQPKPPSGPEGPHATSGSSGTRTVSKGAPPKPMMVRRPNPTPPPESGRCPLRNWPVLGGLIPLTAKGDLACPQAIIAMRAAVARLKPVRELRPQALPVKLIAIGITGMLVRYISCIGLVP